MARRRMTQATATARDEERLQHLVAQKAHQLWEQRGCCHGRDLDDWLEAERLVQQESGVPQSHSVRPR